MEVFQGRISANVRLPMATQRKLGWSELDLHESIGGLEVWLNVRRGRAIGGLEHKNSSLISRYRSARSSFASPAHSTRC